MRRKLATLFLCIILVLGLLPNAFAAEVESEHEYKPLDLVVVLDNSGSMKYSDKEKSALSAVRMLVNMMPAQDSRVCVIGFNTDPIPLTKDSSGASVLVPLADFSGLESVRDAVKSENVPYKGDTGIGNALIAAKEVLASQSDSSHTRAIILFTDGVDDFESTPTAQLREARLAACEENESNAVKWARDNKCPIYCLGYDYAMAGGQSSMGANGEGLIKLQNISDNTGGKFSVIHSIRDMELMMIQFLADVCDLNYKEVVTIPGDGGEHECTIPVSASVVEANIRIAGGDANAIGNGEVHLFDPSGKEIQLANSGNVRYDVDVAAASIKVIMPKPGDWRLTVKGIRGEDIHVGLLEHYRMNLSTQITFPDGNPEGVAYSNDELGVRAWLTYDGKDLKDDDLYAAVTSARVILVSRRDPNDRTEIPLVLGDHEFTGSFVIPEDCVYDATIRLDWDTVYREDTITIHSSNRPLELVKPIEDVSVNKNKTITIDNILQYVRDDENDEIKAELAFVTNADKADVTLNGDQITITGKKMGSTMVTIRYTDDQGNTVESDFRLKVIDPMVYAGIGLIGLALIAALIGLILLIKHASDRIAGKMRVVYIARGTLDDKDNYLASEIIYENPNIHHTIVMETPKTELTTFGGGGGFGGESPLFGGSAFDGSNPDTASTFGGFGGSFGDGPFGTQKTEPVFGTGEPEKKEEPQPSPGLFGDFTLDGGAGQNDSKKEEQEDRKHSEKFDTPVSLGGGKFRKKQGMDVVFTQFMNYYTDHMRTRDSNSPTLKRVQEVVGKIMPVLSRIVLKGTTGRGVGLKVDKKALKNALRVHAPDLKKNGKGSLNSKNRAAHLTFSVIDGQEVDKRIPCIRVDIEYTHR